MIPFARVLMYGNIIAPPAGMRKINSYGLGHLFLSTDDKLYAYGENNASRFGSGSSDAITGGVAKLVLDGVAMIYCHPAYTICLMKDGSFKAAGNLGIFGLGIQLSFVDVSAIFAPVGDVVKVVITRRAVPGNSTVYALNSTGVLYAMGSNNRGQMGNGSAGSIGSFVQINTDCKDVVSCNYETVVVLKNNNTAWFCGNYGLTAGSSDIKVFTDIGDTNILTINSDGYGGCLLYTKSNGLYIRGLVNAMYGLTFTTGAQESNRLAVLPFTFNASTFRYWTDPEGQLQSCWIQNSSTGLRYGTGSSSIGRLGFKVESASGLSFQEQDIELPEGIVVQSISSGNQYSAIIGSDGIVYGSGAFSGFGSFTGEQLVNFPSSNPTLYHYTKIGLGI